MRNIYVVKTRENNYTIYVNKVYLHSKYYPLKTAQKFIEANEKIYKHKNHILMYGIGIGYHLKVLLDKIDKDCKVYAFDADSEIIEKCKNFEVFKEIQNDDRVELFLGYSKNFLKQFCQKMKLVNDIIMYKPSINVLPNKYDDIRKVLESYNISKLGIEKIGNIMEENYKANLNIKTYPIKDFFSKYNFQDKPVVIAAGGPSLEDSLEFLRKHRYKFYIFSLGRTIDIVMKNNIKPDNITIIDASEIVYEQIKNYVDLDIPLLFLSTASKDAVKNYVGEKYIFFNRADKYNKDNIIINTGKTVAVAALDIAIKSGAKTIIFAGQDLAFVGNKFHAGDKIEDNRHSNNLRKVLSVNGKILKTTSGMLEFKRNIENIIEDNPKVTFINCSKGAKIKGTKEIEIHNLKLD